MGMTDRMFDALFHAVEGEIHDCGDGVAHVRGKVDLNALREQLLGEGHTALVNIDTLRFEIADRLSNHYGTPISSDIVHSVLNMHAGSNENCKSVYFLIKFKRMRCGLGAGHMRNKA